MLKKSILKVRFILVSSLSLNTRKISQDESEAKALHVGDVVSVSTKAFAPIIKSR